MTDFGGITAGRTDGQIISWRRRWSKFRLIGSPDHATSLRGALATKQSGLLSWRQSYGVEKYDQPSHNRITPVEHFEINLHLYAESFRSLTQNLIYILRGWSRDLIKIVYKASSFGASGLQFLFN